MFKKSIFEFNLKILSVLILSALSLILSSENSFSQKKHMSKNNQPVALKKDNNNFSQTPSSNYSQQELEIIKQMNQLKQESNHENGEKILKLQKNLESINGSTTTKQETNPIGTLIPASRYNPQETDNISPTFVIDYAGNYIAGMAAQVYL